MINAIKYMDELEQTGFTKEQAKASVNFWMEIMNENLATKNDFKEVTHQVQTLELNLHHELKTLRSEMKLMESSLTIRLGSIMVTGIVIIGYIIKF